MNIHISADDGWTAFENLAAFANILISVLALIVAVVSIWLASKSSKNQIKHNKLSVLPIPYVRIGDFNNHIFVNIKNNGSGPIILKAVKISGGNVDSTDLISLMPSLPSGLFWRNYTSRLQDRSILPGDEVVIIDLGGDSSNELFCKFRDQCRAILSELSISVEYVDIYGDHFVPSERKLDWFARNNI